MTPDYNDNEKERQLLYQGLKRARGFHLYLVQCNDSALRAEILAFLKDRLESGGITLYYRHLEEPVVSLDDFLPPGVRFREQEKAVLVVSGLESSFSLAGEPQVFLHRLNFARDVMPKRFPVPLVLWLPKGAFKKILTEAHDLWSWRSGTFYFSTPPEMVQSQLEKIAALKEKEGGRTLSEKAYKERLILFTDLLEDLKLQPGSQKNQLHQADLMTQIAGLHHSFSYNVSRADQKTGYLEKALEFQSKASTIYEQVFDKDHPDLAASYNNLSLIYKTLGQPEKALEFQLKTLHIRERVFDKNHPELANSYTNLSLICETLGQPEKALEFQLKASTIYEQVFDKNHPSLAASYNNLSLIYEMLGQPEKALEFQLKTLRIREQVFDKNHPDLVNSYNNLAMIYMELKDYESAAVYGEKAVAILQRLFPEGHPNRDMAKRNLEKIKKAAG